MSNLINFRFSLCARLLNQLITCGVFLRWFEPIFPANVEIMLLKYTLLMRPTSLFDGFMSLHSGLFLKLPLWSLSVGLMHVGQINTSFYYQFRHVYIFIYTYIYNIYIYIYLYSRFGQ